MAEQVDNMEAAAKKVIEEQWAGAFRGDERDVAERLIGNTARFSKAGRAEHMKRFQLAYSIYLTHGQSHWFVSKLTGEELPVDKPVDGLRAILEKVIVYGAEDNPKARRNAQQLHSRDTRAARHLLARSVLPTEVVTLAKKKGEGFQAWSVAGTKKKRVHVPADGRDPPVQFALHRNGENRQTFHLPRSVWLREYKKLVALAKRTYIDDESRNSWLED